MSSSPQKYFVLEDVATSTKIPTTLEEKFNFAELRQILAEEFETDVAAISSISSQINGTVLRLTTGKISRITLIGRS